MDNIEIQNKVLCINCINCKCNKIDGIINIKLKICKKCNITNDTGGIFPKNRLICNKCRYKNKNVVQEQAYFKEYYLKNRDKLLENQAENYKKNKILNLIV